MIKKLILVFVLVLTLSACKNVEDIEDVNEDISFNEITYVFNDVSSDGYDMYVGYNKLLEVLFSNDTFIITTVIDEDIFIITGDIDSYEISKNGTIILIDGIDLNPTGSENVSWNTDIIPLMQQYTD